MEQKRQQQQQVNMNLLEDAWFFGNSLLSRGNRSKQQSSSKIMVRCYSDPCPSSTTKATTLVEQDSNNPSSKMSNLLRTPSLPVYFDKNSKYVLHEDDVVDDIEDEDDEPRMSDLIMQAMPMPMAKTALPSRRLARTPSLPPCRGPTREVVTTAAATTKPYSQSHLGSANKSASVAPNGSASVGGVSKKVSVESSVPVLQEKGPIAMAKLTRRASMDPSMLLPPKYTSKGTKQSGSNSKNRPQRKLEPSNLSSPSKYDQPKTQNLDRSKSQKSLSDLEIEELQGLKDLGFSFDNNDISPSVTKVVPALQRRASLDSNFLQEVNKVRRPYLSESWERPLSPRSAPPVPKWSDPKASSSQDVKAQIKFWARAVASNVRQEC